MCSKTTHNEWNIQCQKPRDVRITWEVFDIPVHVELDNTAKEIVELGDLGFWPTGNAFCIFFGKTPASQGDEIRPASAVNILGKITGKTEILKQVKSGERILIEKI